VPTDDRPNILFVSVDQMRADCFGFLGHPVVETPHLDGLASAGVNFSRAYSVVPICVASRAAILTGLNQRHHGFVGFDDRFEWKYDVTLPGLLSESGYQTQAVGKMHFTPARQLMGFDNVILHDGFIRKKRSADFDDHAADDYLPWLRERLGDEAADYAATGSGVNRYVARPWQHDEMLHPTSWVATQSIDFLRRRDKAKPFFLMMSFVRPHPPLDPPEHYWNRYSMKELPDLPVGDWAPTELPAVPFDGSSPNPTDQYQIDLARRAYYAQITYIDHQLNRMFVALFEEGVLENTAIVFTSDHGDMLFDHNMVQKATAFEGSARVPLILRLPQTDRWRKTRDDVDQPVELRDLLPTLCELADVEVPSVVDGRSLLPLILGQANEWREYLHGEHFLAAKSSHWLTDGREKYIWYSQTGRELLFDLEQDPTELHDLSETSTERLMHWRLRLVEELRGREEGFVSDGELVVGRSQSPTLINPGTYQLR